MLGFDRDTSDIVRLLSGACTRFGRAFLTQVPNAHRTTVPGVAAGKPAEGAKMRASRRRLNALASRTTGFRPIKRSRNGRATLVAPEFVLQRAPFFFGFGELRRQRGDFIVQPKGLFCIGGLHQLCIRLLFLVVELGDRSFERADLFADFTFVAARPGPYWALRRRSGLSTSASPVRARRLRFPC